MLGFLMVSSIFLFIVIAIFVVSYILSSIGLFKMAEKEGISNAWLAWIPIGESYIKGKLLENNFTIFGIRIPSPQIVLTIVTAIVSLGGGNLEPKSFAGLTIALAGVVFHTAVIYHLFKKYKGPDSSLVALTIVSVFIPFVWPFCIYSMRNLDPVDDSYSNTEPSSDWEE